ncbi:putative DNA modification/repair radical SAM protein [Fusibacter ferrireducens]|uniref:DNA modification/repair radical SAM protein n=1 Tax=Fusibacter ferrireducens TaxID=2785058 RepID=A0ABR9ZVY1_9FIRM|nr:putative DNA modification/repair radical SAM protein [Fusibacter ferrireducens]MBF4694618.1 putative DNA modification/repair radical SAM protein [Fusibacter ferrireducens]
MEIFEKLEILADAAKYDVSCSSSGSERANAGGLGNATKAGICHSWTDDGRCISLLKILMSNKCIYDCAYCINRLSNDFPRAEFEPEEIVALTINFYRRNYIEGLFLSSAVTRNPNYTMERLLMVAKRLRTEENFQGYIHLKGIPGADEKLIREAGLYADRLSINIELPTTNGLKLLAPQKDRQSILSPMKLIKDQIDQHKYEKRNKALFVPAGQSTQLIVGSTNETDYHIVKLSEALYNKMSLKRVYYSAYVPVNNHPDIVPHKVPPLQREHRIYQADWLLRFYGFKADEIVNEAHPNLDMLVDPKCQWALRNLHLFPMEVNQVSFLELLRIPGIGNTSARRIMAARRFGLVSYESLKKMGVVLKRAKYFITCKGQYFGAGDLEPLRLKQMLLDKPKQSQMSLSDLYPEAFGITTPNHAIEGETYGLLT